MGSPAGDCLNDLEKGPGDDPLSRIGVPVGGGEELQGAGQAVARGFVAE
ncbi:hypothetical protein V1460_25330 [Streptomyces sp. SCSIO 30461]